MHLFKTALRFLRSPVGFLSATMFLNYAGLTIIIPVIPYIVERYTTNVALTIGLITSIASLCQFITGPALGYVSDFVGRRPVLLISLLGGVVGYVVFGIGGALWVLFAGRIIDGLTAGDTTAMYAYVADISESHERARLYGILGAVAAFGFMVGPVIGGLAGEISLTAPLYVAAALSFINVIWGYVALPESLKPEHRAKNFHIRHLNPFTQFRHVLETPPLRILFASMFLFFLGIILQQSNFSVFLKDILHWGPLNIGILLTLVGLVDMLTEGYLINRLLPRWGKMRLTKISIVITMLGIVTIVGVVYSASAALLFAAAVVFSIGDGLFEPAITDLIAESTPPHMHGSVQGASQSTQSVARFVAPPIAGMLYQYAPAAPYLAAVAIMALSLYTIVLFKPVKTA